ncbi:RICIN domain-containing protein [Streptomyces sp. NPDC127190]|uniref:RICIN domain-containing protein n=1 Tax=unclassified Streptomyces TaxID=2593676 RepID=UPI00362EB51C
MKLRLRSAGILAAATALLLGVFGASSAWAGTTPPTDFKWLHNAWTGKCAAVPGGSTDGGTQIIQWPCGPFVDHLWKAVPTVTQGSVVYNHVLNGNSAQCLAVQGGSKEAGAPVIQWPCGDFPDHNWALMEDRYGFRLKNLNSQMCLTIPGGVPDDGIGLIQWPCGDQTDQVWKFDTPTGWLYRAVVKSLVDGFGRRPDSRMGDVDEFGRH